MVTQRQTEIERLTSANDAKKQDSGNGEVANQYTIRENCQSSHRKCQSDTEQLHIQSNTNHLKSDFISTLTYQIKPNLINSSPVHNLPILQFL